MLRIEEGPSGINDAPHLRGFLLRRLPSPVNFAIDNFRMKITTGGSGSPLVTDRERVVESNLLVIVDGLFPT